MEDPLTKKINRIFTLKEKVQCELIEQLILTSFVVAAR